MPNSANPRTSEDKQEIAASLVMSSPASPVGIFRDHLRDGARGPLMMVIPAGEFLMGSPREEPNHHPDESPLHRVEISASFALGVTTVSFDDYDRFAMDTGRRFPDDFGWGRGDQPAIFVNWIDAMAYVAWLSRQTGEKYRLPSEAEWEYAARAGTTTPFATGHCIGTDEANYDGSVDYAGCGADTGLYRERTVSVGSLPANPWGLHEMHGNVFEWTADCWHPNYHNAPADGSAWGASGKEDCLHMARGGSWFNVPGYLRSAFRFWFYADATNNNLGFRIARDFVF
uniref:Formylglycine-generating enzyme, required for sulfatase activity, contains SUMF1/FGE domain n=1 Tax=Candidatus Kentrum sp. SD TaxID=2126332 RepID=A0A450YUF4_9GAMM|nr:MAG: Formylglycine-generating enzyme, required for sulfatase activity, contains SUMF1/FGE domain [Candidatus Kentron sp. SD]VFK45153.1 MAG: Formylglycine-generating enzyme, required for sulfatase activity, contains SUMF1/FGE domain [Candidatus Kentron sp. SD]VFK79362.1 MAG: Formylglycine-generating enzyme, required for sulfatase activity, contains SUMF1/FGE domain [Candidatus Kentron sp. SD]